MSGVWKEILYKRWKILMKTQIRGRSDCDCDFAGDFHILLLDDLWKILMKIHIRGRCDPKHYIADDFHVLLYDVLWKILMKTPISGVAVTVTLLVIAMFIYVMINGKSWWKSISGVPVILDIACDFHVYLDNSAPCQIGNDNHWRIFLMIYGDDISLSMER